MEFTPPFSTWMKQRRKSLDLTQSDLAEAIHYATVTVRRIEEGSLKPSRELAAQLASMLEVPEDQRDEFLAFARGVDVHHPLHTLPAVSTPILHRNADLAVLTDLLSDPAMRLVTLIGPPGVGKTRLAIEVARHLTDVFSDGVCFVPLAALQTSANVATAIAHLLIVHPASGQTPEDALKHALQNRHLLLVLDNFEHVLDAATLVSELLADAPRLTVLATSRAPLDLHVEQTYDVMPLGVPDLNPLPDLDALVRCPSVELFVQRARVVKPAFRLGPENAGAVAELCARLEGLPLSIELAAGRMRMFSPQVLLRHLREDADARMIWLAGGPRDAPLHQRALRATLAWSYRLLSPAQQHLFRRISVFVSSFTLAAVEAMCDGLAIDCADPTRVSPASAAWLDDLNVLLAHNLIRPIEVGDHEQGFSMLETIHEFALEQLKDSGEEVTARDQHASYYAAWADAMVDREDPASMARRRAEMGNLEAAFSWCCKNTASRADAVRLAIAILSARNVLGFFWDQNDDAGDTYRWLLGAAQDESLPASLRMRAAYALSMWAAEHDVPNAQLWAERCLAIARGEGNRQGQVWALVQAATAALMAGAMDQSGAFGREALAIARPTGDMHLQASALGALGWLLLHLHEYDEAIGVVQEMLEFWRNERIDWQLSGGMARGLLFLGRAWQMKGDRERARAFLLESMARYHVAGDPHGMGWAQVFLGFASLDECDFVSARTYFEDALRCFPRAKDSWIGIAECLAGFSDLARRDEDPRRAAMLAGAALNAGKLARGYVPGMTERVELDRIVAEARAQLSNSSVEAAWVEGQALSPDEAMRLALVPIAIKESQ